MWQKIASYSISKINKESVVNFLIIVLIQTLYTLFKPMMTVITNTVAYLEKEGKDKTGAEKLAYVKDQLKEVAEGIPSLLVNLAIELVVANFKSDKIEGFIENVV